MYKLSLLNKKNLNHILATSMLIVVLPSASVVIAQNNDEDSISKSQQMHKGSNCDHGGKLRHGMRNHDIAKPSMPPYLQGLQLSPAQDDQIFALTYPQIPAMRDEHKQRMQLKDDLRNASQADKFDEAKVQQITDKMTALEKEKIVTRARNDANIFAILTPEQRVKAREAKMNGPKSGFNHHEDNRGGIGNTSFRGPSDNPLTQCLTQTRILHDSTMANDVRLS